MRAQHGDTGVVGLDEINQFNRSDDRRVLLRSATIISVDPAVGNLAQGDILVEGKKIVAVAPDLSDAARNADTLVVDASDRVIVPGFQDTHRHCWQGGVRRLLPDVSSVGEYLTLFHDKLARVYRPEDIYLGTLVVALSCIDTGTTNVHDLMHNPRTPEHADAAVTAMLDAGIRATHSQCGIFSGEEGRQWPGDLARIKDRFFSSDDQLLSLRLGVIGSGNFSPDSIALNAERLAFARDLGIGLTSDGVIGKASSDNIIELGRAGLLKEDVLLTHCLDLSDEAWQVMADTGVGVALTPTSDAQFGIADSISPIQKVLDLGITSAGIGVDTDINLTSDLFTQMHALVTIQRMLIFNRRFREGLVDARGINAREVLEFATLNGARATGNAHKVGSLTPGKEADLVVVTAEEINTLPLNNAYATVTSAADTRNVEAVMIGGKFQKWDGQIVGHDMRELARRVAESRDYLLEQAELTYDMFDAPAVKMAGRDYHGHGPDSQGDGH